MPYYLIIYLNKIDRICCSRYMSPDSERERERDWAVYRTVGGKNIDYLKTY